MTTIASALYVGSVVHTRLRPVRHRLRYRMLTFLLDLDELQDIARRLPVFSIDRFNLFSFYGRDHLAGDDTPLRSQIERQLARANMTIEDGPIRLLCMPRVLGFVFNPLSVFFCHGPAGDLRAVLYEVNNTVGERHLYLIPAGVAQDGLHRHACKKDFYVSPFMAMDVRYHFRIAVPASRATIAIEAHDDQGAMFSACFAGRRLAFGTGTLLRLFGRHPMLAAQTLAGIHWEALKLWRKGMRAHPRPKPPVDPVSIVEPMTRQRADA